MHQSGQQRYSSQGFQEQGLMEAYLRSLDHAGVPGSQRNDNRGDQDFRGDLSRIDQNQSQLYQYMNTMKSGQLDTEKNQTQPANKSGPVGTVKRNNMMIGDAIVKKSSKPEEPEDKVKANGGYNGFKTAKDLLKIDFTDAKSESSESTPKPEYKAPPAKGGQAQRRNSFGYGKTMQGAYEDPELYLRQGRQLAMSPYALGTAPYRYGHYPPGPYGALHQDPYSGYGGMYSHMSSMYHPPPNLPYLDSYYNSRGMGGYGADPYDPYRRTAYGNPYTQHSSMFPPPPPPPMYSQPIGPQGYEDMMSRYGSMRSTPMPPPSRAGFGPPPPPPMYSQPFGGYDPYGSYYSRPPPQQSGYQPPPPLQSGYQPPPNNFNPLHSGYPQSGFQSSLSQLPPSYHQSMRGPTPGHDDLAGLDSASVAHQRLMNDEIRRLEDKQNMILNAMKQREMQKSQMFAPPRMQQSQMFPNPNPLPPNPYYNRNIYDTPQPPSTYNSQHMSQPLFTQSTQQFPQPGQFNQHPPSQSMMFPPRNQQGTPLPPSYHQSQVDMPGSFQQPQMGGQMGQQMGGQQMGGQMVPPPPQQNISPQPERPRSSVHLSKNFKPVISQGEPDKVTKANGGYNGFSTAQDLLAINFKDSDSELSDSTIGNRIPPPRAMPLAGKGGPNNRSGYQPSLQPIQEPHIDPMQPKPMFSSGPLLPGTFQGKNDPYGQASSPTPYSGGNYKNPPL